jgi:hypothetical protein
LCRFLSRIVTGDESWIHGYGPDTEQQSSQWKTRISPGPQNERQELSRRLFTKNWVQQDKQFILYIAVIVYSDYVKMCEDFDPNFSNKKAVASQQHTVSEPGDNMTVVPTHPIRRTLFLATFPCSSIEDTAILMKFG